MNSGCGFLVGATCAILALLAVIGFTLTAVENHVRWAPIEAEIEQLRQDAANTPCSASEDVVGQVVETNRYIVVRRQYNRMFIIGLLYPDEWESVALIPVPQQCIAP